MIAAYILFLLPTLLFVLAFLYETWLSFIRLRNPKVGRGDYLSATWEVTHTLLVFAVVMLVMLFTSSIETLAGTIFLSTFIAMFALTVRAACYLYIFYGRTSQRTSWIDWVFALSHVIAALFLVITVLRALWFMATQDPAVNDRFLPYFFPGLALVLAVCAIPILMLYTGKRR